MSKTKKKKTEQERTAIRMGLAHQYITAQVEGEARRGVVSSSPRFCVVRGLELADLLLEELAKPGTPRTFVSDGDPKHSCGRLVELLQEASDGGLHQGQTESASLVGERLAQFFEVVDDAHGEDYWDQSVDNSGAVLMDFSYWLTTGRLNPHPFVFREPGEGDETETADGTPILRHTPTGDESTTAVIRFPSGYSICVEVDGQVERAVDMNGKQLYKLTRHPDVHEPGGVELLPGASFQSNSYDDEDEDDDVFGGAHAGDGNIGRAHAALDDTDDLDDPGMGQQEHDEVMSAIMDQDRQE